MPQIAWCKTQKQFTVCRIIERPKLEETNKGHGVQLLVPHRITQKSDPLSESVVQMLLQLQQLGTMTLESLFHTYHPLVKNLFLISYLTLPWNSFIPFPWVHVEGLRQNRCKLALAVASSQDTQPSFSSQPLDLGNPLPVWSCSIQAWTLSGPLEGFLALVCFVLLTAHKW